jgi:leucyl/phenylalanyl-tRNA--protein transferase
MSVNCKAITLEEGYYFPSPSSADKQGLLCIGGDLHPNRILTAYVNGIFPWFQPGCPILWWTPHPRLVLFPEQFHVSKSLQKELKKPHQITFDTQFSTVINACANDNQRTHETWITPDMITAYETLHHMGYAHSLEVHLNNTLIGGLYGISLGKAFFGESMFYREPNASKVAMYYLAKWCHEKQFHFIDCQYTTTHLLSLGATQLSRKAFYHHLEDSLNYETIKGPWV